jgi:hypothetical protein
VAQALQRGALQAVKRRLTARLVSFANVLAAGRIDSHVAGPGNCWRVYARLLPQLDQQVIFSAFNFNLPPDVDDSSSVTLAEANSTGFVSSACSSKTSRSPL